MTVGHDVKVKVSGVAVEGTVCLTEEFFAHLDATIRASVDAAVSKTLTMKAAFVQDTLRDHRDHGRSESPDSTGLDLRDEDRARARQAQPPSSPLLPLQDGQGMIDSRTLARFLNVAHRTLYRLLSSGAVPAPVALGNTTKRWPVEEVLAWVFAGCPPASEWKTIRKLRLRDYRDWANARRSGRR